MRYLITLSLLMLVSTSSVVRGVAQASGERTPLDIARVLAAKYPTAPSMSYISGLAWSGSLRLAELTGEARWREKPRREMQPFIDGRTPAIAEPFRLTSLAGHLAFADAARLDGNADAGALAQKAAAFILPPTPGGVKFATEWTDDMFMASALLSRVNDGAYAGFVRPLLTVWTQRLQRPDGLFTHAEKAPHAWGRGNGFALLGLTEALTYLPDSWSERHQVLDIYRRHVAAMVRHQSDDGSWRQVVDEPTSYRELTVTAMTTAAMARGISRGWIEAATYREAVDRGWQAVVARVNEDGTLRDVSSGTGANESREYYLTRPIINGADDRGGAMALLAAIEVETLRRGGR